MTDEAKPGEAATKKEPAPAFMEALLKDLLSIPKVEDSYVYRNLLAARAVHGEQQYDPRAHLLEIIRRALEENAVDHLIDTAKTLAPEGFEVVNRLEAWRAPLKDTTFVRPFQNPQQTVLTETTSDGRKYVLLGLGTNATAALSGTVPKGWTGSFESRFMGKLAKSSKADSGKPWSLPAPWLLTHEVSRTYESGPATITDKVYVVPLLQRFVAIALFLGLVGFVACLLLLLNRFAAVAEFPWAPAATFIALVAALPPLRFFQRALVDHWIKHRLLVTLLPSLVALGLGFMAHASLVAVRWNVDPVYCDGFSWPPQTLRVFVDSEDLEASLANRGAPAGCKLTSPLAASACPHFGGETTPVLTIGTIDLYAFRIKLREPESRESCDKKPTFEIRSCMNDDAKLPLADQGPATPLPPGALVSVPATTELPRICMESARRNPVTVWSIGPAGSGRFACESEVSKLGARLAFPPDITAVPLDFNPPANLGPACVSPRALSLEIDDQQLVVTGPIGKLAKRLSRVNVQMTKRDIKGLSFFTRGLEQRIDVLPANASTGKDAIESAWIVDNLEAGPEHTVEGTVDGAPARICKICPRPTSRASVDAGREAVCTLHQQRQRPVFDEGSGREKAFVSCGP